MSILDNLPHTCSAKKRVRVKDTLGGVSDSFSTVFSGRSCWRQQAGDMEQQKWEKRGMSVTNKVFFTSDPELEEQYVLEFTDEPTILYEVVNRPIPDASAGLGVVWRVMVRRQPAGGRT